MEVNVGTLVSHEADRMKRHSEKDDYSYSAYNSSSDEDGDYSAEYGLKIFPEEVISASSFQAYGKDAKVLSDVLLGEEAETGEKEDREEIDEEEDREEIEEEQDDRVERTEKKGRTDIEEEEEEEEEDRSEMEEEEEEEDRVGRGKEEGRTVIEEQHSRAEAEEKEYRTETEEGEEKDRTEIEKEVKDRAVISEEEIKEDSSVRGTEGFSKNESNTVEDSSNSVETQLREALYQEQKSVDAILAELEEVRNTSEAAAMGSMAIIRELQKQKSDIRMEAIQYYRMAEESAQHDQEIMGELKELLLTRETEKLALEKELEMYRQRLLLQQNNIVRWNHSAKASVVTIVNPNSPKVVKTSANTNIKPKLLEKKVRRHILERLQRLERLIRDLKAGQALQPMAHDLMIGKHVSFKETLSYAD